MPVYKLADLQDMLVEGVFYYSDLTRVIKTDDLWRMECILKYRGRPGRKQEVLVRWAGFGTKFDSYILRSSSIKSDPLCLHVFKVMSAARQDEQRPRLYK